MDRDDFFRSMARHLTLGDSAAAMADLRDYGGQWPTLAYIQEGAASAERELRQRAGLPVGLPPMDQPYVDTDRPHNPNRRRFTPAQMA